MILHPLSLCILLLEAAALFLLLQSLPALIQGHLKWDPGSASVLQLRLEPRIEIAFFRNQLGFGLFAMAYLMWIIGVSNVYSQSIPGAMCGLGVIEALSRDALPLVILKSLCLLIYFLFFCVRLETGKYPLGTYHKKTMALLLLLLPISMVSFWQTFQALTSIDASQSVHCCAALITQTPSLAGEIHIPFEPWHAKILAVLALALVALCHLGVIRNSNAQIVLIPIWLFSSHYWLKHQILPYVYGVLEHPCFWCAFRPQYYSQGFIYLGAYLIIIGLAIRIWIATKFPEHRPKNNRGLKVCFWVTVFVYELTALTPACLWKLQSGQWIQ